MIRIQGVGGDTTGRFDVPPIALPSDSTFYGVYYTDPVTGAEVGEYYSPGLGWFAQETPDSWAKRHPEAQTSPASTATGNGGTDATNPSTITVGTDPTSTNDNTQDQPATQQPTQTAGNNSGLIWLLLLGLLLLMNSGKEKR